MTSCLASESGREINLMTSLYEKARVDPGFHVRVAHLKKLRRAEGGAKMFEVFRVKNHDFTPKNLIFSNFRGGASRVRPPPGSTPEKNSFLRYLD